MTALEVRATLAGPICMPEHAIALDALLGAAVCVRDNVPPATTAAELVPIDIPIERSSCGRVYLASVAQFEVERYDMRFVNKRAPIEQYQAIGSPKIKTVSITSGPNKSYRIPRETMHLVDDLIVWWCCGDADAIRALLALVYYLGKRRAVGLGKILRWDVEPVRRPWDGFPVLCEGEPIRTLPDDYPGLSPDADRGIAVLEPPYWDRTREQLCAVPQAQR